MPKRPLNILIVEDDPASLEAIQSFLEFGGHAVYTAEDGHAAIHGLERSRPDLVLLDVGLPGSNGFEVAREIRHRFGPRWVPIIFLSARKDQDDVLKGLAAGGDDYLMKPVSYPLLTAKIQVMQRICELQTDLVNYFNQSEYENNLAQSILERLLHSEARTDPRLKWVVMPLHRFSGDQILVQRNPDGAMTLLLADGLGHGLPAAISLMPVLKTFVKLAAEGVPLGEMAREMNSEHRLMLPSSRFTSVLLMKVDPHRRILEVWNGGIPICLLVDDRPELVHRFRTAHPPIGIDSDADFEDEVESIAWTPERPLVLIASTDGIMDARNQAGVPFGEEGLLRAILNGPSSACYERALAGVYLHLEGAPASDDISLLSMAIQG
ncbi:MAG TPA: SpoIIE family protein phosphatase [Holophagaceae bacterium]|nr:SpoIIE family protein phosphatase [Holophagaceae bacterium]